MQVLPHAILAGLLLLTFQEKPSKPAAFDYAKVDRKIATQPKYVAAPQYGLLVLGSGAKGRVWMVLDKSTVEQPFYDVLYIDVDGDGNLGEPGERFEEKPDKAGARSTEVGRIAIPGCGLVLENVVFRNYHAEEPPFVLLSMRVNGKVDLHGGYESGKAGLRFAESPEKAPILHADPEGPLAFLLYDGAELQIGHSQGVRIMVGAAGSGGSTFMAVDENFLNLKEDKIFVTLIATDRAGKEIRARTRINGHC